MKKVVFPGSFDPFHNGHKDVVDKIIDLFDEIVIAVGNNLEKKSLFSIQERKKLIEKTFSYTKKIKVEIYSGLTIDFCKQIDAKYIVRGIRNSFDFEYEKSIAYTNTSMSYQIKTIFVLTSIENSFISSSIVRDIIKNNGNIEEFVPWNSL